jgi:hypothetical protein
MANGKSKSKIRLVKNEPLPGAVAIPKPPTTNKLDRFRSKTPTISSGVETLLGALPHHNISQAKDFVRLHRTAWSCEYALVDVPIKGVKKGTLHLIDEEVAERANLAKGKILRLRFALASKPHDIFFLCHIASQNLDNGWNVSALEACEKAKDTWVQVISQKSEGFERYKIDAAKDPDAFPDPKWPSQSIEDLIDVTFAGCQIDHDEHPALLRLIGRKQSVS